MTHLVCNSIKHSLKLYAFRFPGHPETYRKYDSIQERLSLHILADQDFYIVIKQSCWYKKFILSTMNFDIIGNILIHNV